MLNNMILSLIVDRSLLNPSLRGYEAESSITVKAFLPSGNVLLTTAIPLIEVNEYPTTVCKGENIDEWRYSNCNGY